MSKDNIPDRARVVVVGGGVIGTSVAYHLARGRADGHVRVDIGDVDRNAQVQP